MSIIEAIILGIIQGLTEFIPVSSSGHLILAQDVLGFTDGGLLFDVALHVGTLLSLVVFFRRDITDMVKRLAKGGKESRLPKLLIVATLPAIIVGIFLQGYIETSLRSGWVVVSTLITVGIFMIYAERRSGRKDKMTSLENVSKKQALLIGLAQALALIPGVSRSGSTITAGLFVGLDRVSATRFSFLLAIPVTFGAVMKVLVIDRPDLWANGQMGAITAGVLSSFLAGLLAIGFLLRFVANNGLETFAYYRFAIAAFMLLLLT